MSDRSAPKVLKMTPQEIKDKMIELLDEYLAEGDIQETKDSLVELQALNLNYKFVELAITKVLEKPPQKRQSISQLFSHLNREAVFSQSDFAKG